MEHPDVALVTRDLTLLDAAVGDPADLGRLLGGRVIAEDWTRFPGALENTRDAVAADPARTGWGARLFVIDDPPALVGWGGFKGPPRGGSVEIGYAVAPAFEGRGIASAAVRAMLRED